MDRMSNWISYTTDDAPELVRLFDQINRDANLGMTYTAPLAGVYEIRSVMTVTSIAYPFETSVRIVQLNAGDKYAFPLAGKSYIRRL